MRSTVRAYLELARISNLPTCLSNVLVGVAIGYDGTRTSWTLVGMAGCSVALLYIAGMILNDAVDARIDATERPNRPIPSGRIPRSHAFATGFIAMAAGVVIAARFGTHGLLLGLSLATTILLYDILHKKHPGAVLLMGLCRGQVYLLGAASVAWPLHWDLVLWPVVIVTLYTVLLTVVARHEAGESVSHLRSLAWLMPLLVLALAIGLRPFDWSLAVAAAVIVVGVVGRGAWLATRTPARTMEAVQIWLAGFCMIDAFALSLLGRPQEVALAAACFILTIFGQRLILGT